MDQNPSSQPQPAAPTPPAPQPNSAAPGQPPVLTPVPAPPRHTFNPVRAFFSALGPVLVIGGLAGFVLYSLYVYKPTDRLACSDSVVEQQADIAINVVRQWFGKQSQDYAGCRQP
jgi:hypothetical protein